MLLYISSKTVYLSAFSYIIFETAFHETLFHSQLTFKFPAQGTLLVPMWLRL